MNRGKYIVFEGCDGTGKSTQAALLSEAIDGIMIREPGGDGAIGDKIRQLILDPANERANPITDVLLHAAARCEIADTTIRPALHGGKHVVGDRYWGSSVAYQGAQGVKYSTIWNINRYALRELQTPDLVFLLDAPIDINQERLSGKKADIYESRERDFHETVRENYLQFAKGVGAIIINATSPAEVVANEVREWAGRRLGI